MESPEDDYVRRNHRPGRPYSLVPYGNGGYYETKGHLVSQVQEKLKGEAVGWYRNLPKGSINSFEDLEKAFKIAFGHKVRRKVLNTTLLRVVQGDQESTREYIDRFAAIVQRVVCSEEGVLMTLINGLMPTTFSGDLVRDPPVTFAETMERSYKE